MEKIKIGELLKNGLKILVENPIFFVLGLIVNLPFMLVGSKIDKNMLYIIIWCFLINPYFIGLIMRFIYESREKKPSWRDLSKFVASKYMLLLITFAMYYLLTLIGTVLFIIPGIFLSIKLILCDYGIILENDGAIASLKRSWAITKGNWWRLFVLLLVIYLPVIILEFFEKLFPRVIYSVLSLLLFSGVFVWSQSTFTLAYLRLRENKK